jgi:hypothetical protein
MTNARIFCILGHPACGGFTPVSPPPHAIQTRDRMRGPLSPSPEMGQRGGGTCKPAHVGWPREQKILALTWQGWGGSTRCTKASSSSILSADLKVKPEK